MKNNLIILILCFVIGVNITSCGSKENNEAIETTGQKGSEHNDEHENSNTVTLTAEQMKSIGLELGGIEQKQLTATLKANGVLKVPNQNRANVSSVYSGVVKSLLVQPGNIIRQGQIIATIANPEFIQVQSEYLNLNSKIALAELEVRRQKELNEGNAGALKNLQAAETELRTLRTARSTHEQQIRLMGINPAMLKNGKLVSVLAIRSPINGVVSDVKVEMGSYVDVSTTIAEIVDNSRLHLDLFVYEKDMSKLKNDQLIHFTLTNNPGKEYDAKIYSLGSSFEGESKAVSVHARVQGDKTGLIDGMTITAAISLETQTLPAVPSEAIINIGGQDYIFMLVSQNKETGMTFEKTLVAKGTTGVGYTEITLLKEIPADAKIVMKGAFFVSAKMNNTGEHEH